MGYSISVPCKSTKAAEDLGEWLREHTVPFSRLLLGSPEREALAKLSGWFPAPCEGDIRYDPTQHICIGAGLAYGAGPSKVGFNFSTSSIYGLWMYGLTAWAALRVGRKRGVNALARVGHADQRVMYTTYDSEPTPVLTPADIEGWSPEAQDEARWQWLVNDDGLREQEPPEHYAKRVYGDTSPNEFIVNDLARKVLIHAVAKRELERLSTIWSAR